MDKETKKTVKNQSMPRNSVILEYCNKIYTPKTLTTH